MHSGNRGMLRPQHRIRFPARIKQHEQRLNVVFCSDREENIDPFFETRRVLFNERCENHFDLLLSSSCAAVLAQTAAFFLVQNDAP